jgi:hypothetical protein
LANDKCFFKVLPADSSSSGQNLADWLFDKAEVKYETAQKQTLPQIATRIYAITIQDYGNLQISAKVVNQTFLFMQEDGERCCRKTLLQASQHLLLTKGP